MSNPNEFIKIPVNDEMIWKAINHKITIKENAAKVGNQEIFKDEDSWQGFLCELAVEQWLGNLAVYDQPITRADKYDFLMAGLKGDVKGSLLLNQSQYKKKVWINLYLFCQYNPELKIVTVYGWQYRNEVNCHRLKKKNMKSPAYEIDWHDLRSPTSLHSNGSDMA